MTLPLPLRLEVPEVPMVVVRLLSLWVTLLGALVLRLVVLPLVLRFTCGVASLRRLTLLLVLLPVLRLTCGVASLRRLVVVLPLVLRFTCGVAALRLMLLLLELLERVTVGAVDLLGLETAADWLLLLVLPPCERLRPWAIASDALKIRHPMRAKLIMIFVTEVFIILLFYNVQQVI